MRLDHYLSSWRELLCEGRDVDLGLAPEVSRLYRGFVQNHYLDVLPKVYARLDSLWDCPWEEWRDGYFQQYPPHAWELNHLAEHFAAYLERNRLLGEDLIDLVKYEWAEYSVYTCFGSQQDEREEGFYSLNPAHKLLELRFDIANWVFEWERDHGVEPLSGRPSNKPNIIIISRNPKTLGCVITQCDVFDLTLYQAIEGKKENPESLFSRIQDIFPFTKQQFKEKISFLKRQSIIKGGKQ